MRDARDLTKFTNIDHQVRYATPDGLTLSEPIDPYAVPARYIPLVSPVIPATTNNHCWTCGTELTEDENGDAHCPKCKEDNANKQ